MSTMENSAIIPIDDKIQHFADYLAGNKRCILSARFGDGKTFFLQEFKQKYEKDYIFLTIYPVNYQVADNKDIFEYIKRDLLIQLLMSGEIVLSDEKYGFLQCLEGFIGDNIGKLLNEAILSTAHILNRIPTSMLDTLKKNISKFKKYKNDLNTSSSDVVESYIDSFSKDRGGIYEFDPISRLIFELLSDLKQTTNKQVVLVVEDLDRIDPAHIFRIMNIFSAHWDNYDYSETKLNCGDVENKYNFDKILVVCHFQNIKNIFHHFYGENTDFTGYIHKYSPTSPFEYSLKESVREWIIGHLPKEIQSYDTIGEILAELILQRYFTTQSLSTNLRHITFFLTEPKYRIIKETIIFGKYANYEIESYNRVTILLSIFKEFRIDIDEFFNSNFFSSNNDRTKRNLIDFIGPCWLLYQGIAKGNDVVQFHQCSGDSINCSTQGNMYFDVRCKTIASNSEYRLTKYIVKEIDTYNPYINFDKVGAMKQIFTKCKDFLY